MTNKGRRRTSRLGSDYFYLKVLLETEDDAPLKLPINNMQFTIQAALKTLFGEVGKAIPVDILHYRKDRRDMILRVPAKDLAKLRCSLTLYGECEKVRCAFRIQQISSSLVCLAVNRQEYMNTETPS